MELVKADNSLDEMILNAWLQGKVNHGLPDEDLTSEFISAYVCNNIVSMLRGELPTVTPSRNLVDKDLRTVERMGNTAFLSSGFIRLTDSGAWYGFTREELISLAYFSYRMVARPTRRDLVVDDDFPTDATDSGKCFLDSLADNIREYANLLSDVYREIRIGHLPSLLGNF